MKERLNKPGVSNFTAKFIYVHVCSHILERPINCVIISGDWMILECKRSVTKKKGDDNDKFSSIAITWGEGFMTHSLTAHFFSFFFFCSGDQLTHINSTFQARISPQWHSELRHLWLNVPWQFARELISLTGSHTMPGQHSQPTVTSLGQGYRHV